jgi:hypothetical protein
MNLSTAFGVTAFSHPKMSLEEGAKRPRRRASFLTRFLDLSMPTNGRP